MGNAFHRHDYMLSNEEVKQVKSQTGFSSTQVQRLFRRFHHLDKEGKGYLTKHDLMHVHEIVLNPMGERIAEMFLYQKHADAKVRRMAEIAEALGENREEAAAAAAKREMPSLRNNSESFLGLEMPHPKHRSNPVIVEEGVNGEMKSSDCVDHHEAAQGRHIDKEEDRIHFIDFARTFSMFRPISNSTPSYAVNSREAKLKYLFNLIDLHHDGQFTVEELHDLLEQMMGAKVEESQLMQIAERIVSEADTSGNGAVTFREFKEATKELDVEGRMSFISFS